MPTIISPIIIPQSTIRSPNLNPEATGPAPLVFVDPDDPDVDVVETWAPEAAEELEPEVPVGVGAAPVV